MQWGRPPQKALGSRTKDIGDRRQKLLNYPDLPPKNPPNNSGKYFPNN